MPSNWAAKDNPALCLYEDCHNKVVHISPCINPNVRFIIETL